MRASQILFLYENKDGGHGVLPVAKDRSERFNFARSGKCFYRAVRSISFSSRCLEISSVIRKIEKRFSNTFKKRISSHVVAEAIRGTICGLECPRVIVKCPNLAADITSVKT